ncbi:hypothetical protein [Streptomyces lichenis]|uniref:Transcription termination factor Rho n=1 Tax=Streptomyces lichenis TaxID=2306967 RepID=A0ABT0IA72_9ACTN|nr:hypothetical protein [Streptomyces lichenis]MCK8678232.1 hypothetical protein [Streptomyces lichenis]
MTVPEDRPKTDTTDQVVDPRDDRDTTEPAAPRGATGRTMGEALEEAGLRPEDVERDE